ncbi:hypothetical protein [Thalassobacillus sp. C254]|uniref:hypothetical protein n=1 Tax=Thalassobacillus sp. C254 TaxID=1225341 RepID=UPI0006D23F77|nr:hypothetical protein [Thalassobacillus sp. C254]
MNIIGAIDYQFNDQHDIPSERTLTIINPIRLISFLKQTQKIQTQVEYWLEQAAQGNFEVEKREDYLDHIFESYNKCAPLYMTSDRQNIFILKVTK